MLLINDFRIVYDFSVWQHFPTYQTLLLVFLSFLIKLYYNKKKEKKKEEEIKHIPVPPTKDIRARRAYTKFRPLQREFYFRKHSHDYLSFEYENIIANIKFKTMIPKKWKKYPRLSLRPHNFFTFMPILWES